VLSQKSTTFGSKIPGINNALTKMIF